MDGDTAIAAASGAASGIAGGVAAALAVLRSRLDRTDRDVGHLLTRDRVLTTLETHMTHVLAELRDIKRALNIDHRVSDRDPIL